MKRLATADTALRGRCRACYLVPAPPGAAAEAAAAYRGAQFVGESRTSGPLLEGVEFELSGDFINGQ